MAIFKCKICGGNLDLQTGISVATCEYCGTKQTVTKSRDDVVANLFNRANNLRLKCEFDKAEQVYEKILDIDNTDSEAHWGIVLCKYGIEYVEDAKTYTRIPTCHRTLYEAVLADVDYLAAVENAEAEQKELYIAEAKAIDELQRNILKIVNNEEHFDVFICYKETDENGKRTIDSSISNDIYYQLTQEGFKVFYAPITLEDKLGQEYEPYIFAALNSAKMMLVIGTKPEYFDSIWVRNEWSRFLKLTKSDRTKLLIPCYKDMDAYELPNEFAHLQAQDMSKIGFISDVIRGLRKVLNCDEQNSVTISKKKKIKTSKFKRMVDNFKRKKQEKAGYCLIFPIKIFSMIFYFLSVLLYLYFGIKVLTNLNDSYDALISSLYTIMGILIPSLILAKVIKNKIISIILQGISLSLYICLCFMDIPYMIEYGFYLFIILSTLLTFIWFILICFSRRANKTSFPACKIIRTIIPAILFAMLIIVAIEFGGTNFCDYQLAKAFYSAGAYEYANDYFVELGDYKDSFSFAKKSKMQEIKNAEYLCIIELGHWVDGNTVYDGLNYDDWYVIAKEDNKVLLLRADPVLKSGDSSIKGGWKNSSIRTFLNTQFYDITFPSYVKDHVITYDVINPSDSNDVTKDKIFILSKNEIEEYLPEYTRQNVFYRNNLLRNVENNIYTILTAKGHFTEMRFSDDMVAQKDTNTDGEISFAEYSAYKVTFGDDENINLLADIVYHPAMWIDVSNIE